MAQWHKKNCEPLVLGPALAIDSTPGPVCSSWKPSSEGFYMVSLKKGQVYTVCLRPLGSFCVECLLTKSAKSHIFCCYIMFLHHVTQGRGARTGALEGCKAKGIGYRELANIKKNGSHNIPRNVCRGRVELSLHPANKSVECKAPWQGTSLCVNS